jgi:homogentisate 1,2-dioxygenase
MPAYHSMGQVPGKRHSLFYGADGRLYTEDLIGNDTAGISSLLYHLRPPTRLGEVRYVSHLPRVPDPEPSFRHRHFRTAIIPSAVSPTLDRRLLLFNAEVSLSFVYATMPDRFFYRNAQADELLFVSTGSGRLASPMGLLEFRAGDFVVIPRGILHQFQFEGALRALVIESRSDIRLPGRYRNQVGQLLEIAPYCERDLHPPSELPVRDETGEFRLVIKKADQLQEVTLIHHPFDVVGWDGYYYPYTFNIADFDPRIGRFHLPPPAQETFEGDGYVVCSYTQRASGGLDDKALTTPYVHANVAADEVVFHDQVVEAGSEAEPGSITLHPQGLPHGPHPGHATASESRAAAGRAIMLIAFQPLHVAVPALAIEDRSYHLAWLTE